jgi:hypothetical protein
MRNGKADQARLSTSPRVDLHVDMQKASIASDNGSICRDGLRQKKVNLYPLKKIYEISN